MNRDPLRAPSPQRSMMLVQYAPANHALVHRPLQQSHETRLPGNVPAGRQSSRTYYERDEYVRSRTNDAWRNDRYGSRNRDSFSHSRRLQDDSSSSDDGYSTDDSRDDHRDNRESTRGRGSSHDHRLERRPKDKNSGTRLLYTAVKVVIAVRALTFVANKIDALREARREPAREHVPTARRRHSARQSYGNA